MSGEQVADALAKLATVADKIGIDGCAVNLAFVKDDDRLLSGDLIPTIVFSLKRREQDAEPMPADVIDVELQ
jgi:hypothetical protein